MKKLDMMFGNPAFLQELWLDNSFGGFASQVNSTYDHTSVSDDLKSAILALHKVVGNVKDPESYTVVIGNGASQILTAISRSIKVGVYAPFWSRFNYLIEDMQLFTSEWPHSNTSHDLLVTYPNNPNGALSPAVLEAQIVDASYHWPSYYPNNHKLRALDNDILIFSFSKLSGLSSNRLGWALVKNSELAAQIKQHVEMSTCGVSPAVQQIAAQAIDQILLDESFFAEASKELQSRWEFINSVIPYNWEHRGIGMFFYFKDTLGKLKSLGIDGFSGRQFGDTDDFIRINIGVSKADFEEFKARLLGSV